MRSYTLPFVHCGNRQSQLQQGMSEIVERYRSHAAECLRIAQSVSPPKEKLALVNMAQCWLDLAEQTLKNIAAESLSG
jgi:hypothetical protein